MSFNFNIYYNSRPKLKKLFVSCTRPTEIVTGSSDIVPEFTFGTGLHF